MHECAVALSVHRNTKSDALVVTSGMVTKASETNTYGFGYGRGPIALMVRYDTRVRTPSPLLVGSQIMYFTNHIHYVYRCAFIQATVATSNWATRRHISREACSSMEE